jgi:hypothetical protein
MACGACGNKNVAVKVQTVKPQVVKVSPVNPVVVKANQVKVKKNG